MIRCRQCNSELKEQARFCNFCGLPQNPQVPEPEHSIRNGEKTLETISNSHCKKCGTEISKEARFCVVCGTPRTSKIFSEAESVSNEALHTSITKNNESAAVHVQHAASIKPEQAIITVDQQQSKVAENASIRPKTIKRPPVVPSRPTNNGLKPSASIQQPKTPVPESSESRVYSTQTVHSMQTPEELSISRRAPGLIRPITPKSSSRSVIQTHPDSVGQAISSRQPTQITGIPEYPISSSPTKAASQIHDQARPNASPAAIQPASEGTYKRPIDQLATEHIHAYSQPTVNANGLQNHPQEKIANAQTMPTQHLRQNPSLYDSSELETRSTSIVNTHGNNGVSDTPTKNLLNPASFMATSMAAEQWRRSWRDRQYAEAGPAENVSRGQASVPTPLTPMHQSLERMRITQKSGKKQQNKRSVKLGTWITILLMICLIIGLGGYIIISYIPNSPFGVPPVTPTPNTLQPTLVTVGTTSQSITVGQSIRLHGEHFDSNQTIIFLRDTATPIVDRNGNNISTRTDNQGAFDVTISIDSNWSVGSHSIEALDKSSSQNAFQTIQIIPAGTATTSSTELSVSMQGKPASLLTFTAVIGQGNPNPQQITITNTSGSPLNWTATALANNNLNWLMINDNNNYGQLAISQPHSILISVNTVGLKITGTKHPYTGQIIFTINNSHLLTLPIQLKIVDTTPEMVFSPDPIIAPIGSGNTCQSGVTLTLINLDTAAISWAVNPDLTGKIKFVSNGKLLESGTLLPSGSLLPSGQPGDTVVLTLQCTNIQQGQSYHVSVYANKLSWSELVIVQ